MPAHMSVNTFADVYTERFFEGIDGVTNALDNIKARECMRRLDIYYLNSQMC